MYRTQMQFDLCNLCSSHQHCSHKSVCISKDISSPWCLHHYYIVIEDDLFICGIIFGRHWVRWTIDLCQALTSPAFHSQTEATKSPNLWITNIRLVWAHLRLALANERLWQWLANIVYKFARYPSFNFNGDYGTRCKVNLMVCMSHMNYCW